LNVLELNYKFLFFYLRSKEGACGFIPQFLNYNPFALIRVDEDTDEVLRQNRTNQINQTMFSELGTF